MRPLVIGAVVMVGCAQSGGGVVCRGTDPRGAPAAVCDAPLAGAWVCSGSGGFTCTTNGCWERFEAGPCAMDASVDGVGDGGDAGTGDAGRDAGHDPVDAGPCPESSCPVEGAERCVTMKQRCIAGCWTDVGRCEDAGLCSGSPAPVSPAQPCTAPAEGVIVCPEGPTSGYGYQCSGGCWRFLFDGPCASGSVMEDGGYLCQGIPCAVSERGQRRCNGLADEICGNEGCWVPVALCTPDGG